MWMNEHVMNISRQNFNDIFLPFLWYELLRVLSFRPVHVLLSRFYPDLIQILSRFYLDFILILSWFYPDFLETHFIQILQCIYPDFIWITFGLNQDKIEIKSG